jgi:MGT family glycosyltransferase
MSGPRGGDDPGGGPVVAICVQGLGHIRAMLPVLACLQERGREVHVMTREDLRPEVERIGARFIDLFDGRPVEEVDDSSIPVPSRYVTFAAIHAEGLAAEVGRLSPSLIIYETYSVMGPLIGRALGIPYVNVSPNHALVPERAVAALEGEARVSTSPECLAAVERLRTVHGIEDASPFSYVAAVSPCLNLYPEPREFLSEEDRAALEPLAFFGLLAPGLYRSDGREPAFSGREGRRRILVSFGTIAWIYYAQQALAALQVLAEESEELGDVELLVSLGGHPVEPGALEPLRRPHVAVRDRLDQWAALREADLFVTHHGINSTHEAIYHRVPMLSYPLSADQPVLAARCQELGLALPLAAETRGEVAPGALAAALERLDEDSAGFAARLEEARSWELRTIAERDEVVERILALAGD